MRFIAMCFAVRYRLSMLEAPGSTLNKIDCKESGPKFDYPTAFGRPVFNWHRGLVQIWAFALLIRFTSLVHWN